MFMGTGSNCNTAIYCRLSKDDGKIAESSSISTQREILTQYVKSQGWKLYDEYIDDGYTGLNFNRPDFQRMIGDIKDGKINCVITKDLSRLGRNYLDCGAYIEIFFPENNVRYLALNDGVDTINSSTADFTPFRNILNEMYSKDISKKVKSAKKAIFLQGKYTGTTAPYGYIKSPDNKHQLIVDEQTAHVVRRIFQYAKDGLGISRIRQIMTDEKILRPGATVFHKNGNYERHFAGKEENRFIWSNNSVRGILRNPVYAGHLAGYKRIMPSMKSTKRLSVLPENYQIVSDTHEPIISQEDFDIVQRLITSRRKGKMYTSGYDNVFSGLIKCADCGYAMAAKKAHRTKRPDIIDCIVYQCNQYSTYGVNVCKSHNLEARNLHNEVLADINKHAKSALKDDKKLIRRIENRLNFNSKSELKIFEGELRRANTRLAELDRLFARLYEDKVINKISERNYEVMSKRYEQEQLRLEGQIAVITSQLNEAKETSSNAARFVNLIKDYAGIETLTAALLNTLIDKITASEVTIVDGERVQTVKIYYKFIGCMAQP